MTDEQTTIFGAGRTLVDGKPLTPRQQIAWDMVRRSAIGVSSDEAGAALHQLRGRHDDETRCAYCTQEGAGVFQSRALKGLVQRKRATGRWYCRNREDALVEQAAPAPAGRSLPDSGYDPATSEIPF